MNINFVPSPSNLKTFRTCPYKFERMYIKKDVPKKPVPALERGIKIHSWMENAVKHGWDSIEWLENRTRDTAYGAWQAVHRLQLLNWDVQAEVDCAIDGLGNRVDWWEQPPLNWLRCKLDVLAVSPDGTSGIVIDWKTGRPWDDELQLMCNVMCAATGTEVKHWHVMYYYLDSGTVRDYKRSVESTIYRGPLGVVPVHGEIVTTCMEGIQQCFEDGLFPAVRSKFCGSCDIEDCQFYRPDNVPLSGVTHGN